MKAGPAILLAALAAAALALGCEDERAASGSANVSVGPQVFADASPGADAPLIVSPKGEAPSEREAVLGWSLALIALLGTASFLLSGRVGASVHVALSLLSVLVAVFGLYLLLGTASTRTPVIATAALAVLLVVLKLMSRFETTLKPKSGPRG